MSHARSLGFDALESRELLSRAPHAAAQRIHSEIVVPVVLDGTLTVNNKAAATTSTNGFGGRTISTPVAGTLSGVGEVRGVWKENLGSFANYLGPNALVLHDRQGTFNIKFGTEKAGTAHRTATGAVFNPISQHLSNGSGAYVRATESGTVVLNTNASKMLVKTMTLNTTS